jgi:hypothetical protein
MGGCQLLVSRITGHVVLGRFHFSGFGVYQGVRSRALLSVLYNAKHEK